MPLDVLDRYLRPLRRGRATSGYPTAAPDLAPAARGLPVLDPAACDLTGACVTACPTGAIAAVPGAWRLDAGKCVMCDACVAACPTGALHHASGIELAARRRRELVALQQPAGPGAPQGATPSDESASGRAATSERSDADLDEAGSRLAEAIRRGVGRSLHVRHLDAGSCNGCDWEMNALLNPYHDVQRFGVDFVASPRHADVLLVTGTMTRNLEEAAVRTYEAMPEPRLVIAVGACAISGGVFAGSYAGRDGICEVLPVDVFIPGCPPRPETLIQGLLLAMDRWRPRA
jgi:Ni,Fe-hydrogenase III small subunit/formate hydrogenlyase subunit 6/NADH:ubiquinone oxidoreductase subunit I